MYPTQAMGRRGSPRAHQIRQAAAPIGGLNTKDSLAAMPSTDCPALINWIPDVGGLRSRDGFIEWAVDFPDALPIRSILSYFGPDAGFPAGTFLTLPTTMPGEVFAATDDEIYDVTSATNTPGSVKTLSGAEYAGHLSHTMLVNSGGSFLLVCSETDGYFYYNGTSWVTPIQGPGAGEIDNVDPADFVHVNVWKKRTWFVERDSTRAWYLPAEAITGAASVFDFGPLFKRGGHLAFLANWTLDAGEGIDDFLVAVSSNGDVIIYQGTDPDSASTFSLVGSWYVGQIPIGRRGYAQLGGDLLLLSTEGVFPVSEITRGGDAFLAAGGRYSEKIKPSLGKSVRSSFTQYGWQLAVHSTQRLLVASTPDTDNSANFQYVLSTSVNGWTTFNNIPALCLGPVSGYMMSGTSDGRVLLLAGSNDSVTYNELDGESIRGVVQFAFNAFEAPSQEKKFLMVRPSFLAALDPGLVVDVSVNYTFEQLQGAVPNPNALNSTEWDGSSSDPYDLWNTGYWDGVPGERALFFADWRTVSGLGFSGAANMTTRVTAPTLLTSMDYMYQVGGPF